MDNKILGRNIKLKREERGMSRVELAEKVGVTPQGLCSWEIGRTEPKFVSLIKLSEILNCPISDFLFDTVPGTENQTVTEIFQNNELLTEEEEEFIEAFRKASVIAKMKAYKELIIGAEEE